jgi:23S rRNA (cytidine1920-2'-O)/16S rRNA (cytidine1409-2'-O)-methyltransferase
MLRIAPQDEDIHKIFLVLRRPRKRPSRSTAMNRSMSAAAKRLDQVLVERGLAETRARAQALVLAGEVWSGDKRLDKAGQRVADDAPLEVKGRDHPYVSRGGLKLAHGLAHFRIDPRDKVALDIGASTGGFTDVLLRAGARRVYAVDVGHGQLAWKLRQDPRVVVLEQFNARHLGHAQIPEPVDLIVCDASFIGLELVLPPALALAAPGAELVALIKPQFEVGKGRVGKGGVVRDPALHQEVCARIAAWLGARPGWQVLGVTPSPIRGPEGNVEFLIGARYSA